MTKSKNIQAPKKVVIAGGQYGHLTLVRLTVDHRHRVRRRWLCQCVCGTEVEKAENTIVHGKNPSCGCQRRLLRGPDNPSYKHGLTDGKKQPPEVIAYHGMKWRCYSTRSPEYRNYGGRGITIAPEWLGEGGLQRFLEHVGPRPSDKHSLDRINNNGNYEPGNVRWATAKEQSRNKRLNRLLTYNGVTLPVCAWVERTGLHQNTIDNRIKSGWSIEETLTTPPLTRRSQRGTLELGQ